MMMNTTVMAPNNRRDREPPGSPPSDPARMATDSTVTLWGWCMNTLGRGLRRTMPWRERSHGLDEIQQGEPQVQEEVSGRELAGVPSAGCAPEAMSPSGSPRTLSVRGPRLRPGVVAGSSATRTWRS